MKSFVTPVFSLPKSLFIGVSETKAITKTTRYRIYIGRFMIYLTPNLYFLSFF